MTLIDSLFQLVHSPGRSRGITSILRHFGGFGVFVVAIIDSMPLPTFSGADIVIALLAMGHRHSWYYFAALGTAGSLIGAYFTYRMAHRAGMSALQRKFGERKVERLLKYFEHRGTGALAVVTAVPFPFPTSAFFAAAGVVDYPSRRFLIVVALSRALRFGAIAAIASHYGGRVVVGLRHLGHYWFLGAGAAIVIAIIAVITLKKRLQSGRQVPKPQAT